MKIKKRKMGSVGILTWVEKRSDWKILSSWIRERGDTPTPDGGTEEET